MVMKEEKINPVNVIENFDQAEQTLINFSGLAGSYYEALVKNNVPSDLAQSLVTEWHKMFWAFHFGGLKK